jgi:hypothetical protein
MPDAVKTIVATSSVTGAEKLATPSPSVERPVRAGSSVIVKACDARVGSVSLTAIVTVGGAVTKEFVVPGVSDFELGVVGGSGI